MNKTAIKNFAIAARLTLIDAVTQRAFEYEVTEKGKNNPDQAEVNGKALTPTELSQRRQLIDRIRQNGFSQTMEEAAYTWFNRFIALRFMEVNGYLPSHVRIFTNDEGEFKPQILSEAIHLDLDGLNMDKVYELKNANKDEELFKYLLIVQCNALNKILPGMFQRIEDFTELLLPDYLLREGSVIEKMISEIPEDNFDVSSEDGQIEIIGWLYQYYISEKHEEVVDPLHGKVVKKEEVPAATQLFTTDWVVRYLIDNSVGRYWIERNPGSTLADKLTYFVKPKDGTIKTVNEKITPQDVTTFDPCVGSGHFLIYAFDVLMKIYVEYGYSERDAAAEIVKNNLFGLDIDGRASQLAYFSVMMKARQYDRRFLSREIQPHIFEITESNTADRTSIEHFYGSDAALKKDVEALLDTLKDAKEYGSILQMPTVDLGRINERFAQLGSEISMYNAYLLGDFQAMIQPAEIMSGKYAVVATNPPYFNKYDAKLKKYITECYKDYSGDLFSVFVYRNFDYCRPDGYSGFMTPFVWMFIKTYEKLREYIVCGKSITTLIQFEYSAYEEATVPICSFVLGNNKKCENGFYFRLSEFTGGMEVQRMKIIEAQKNKDCGYYYETKQDKLANIPGTQIGYWLSDKFIESFENYPLLGTIADAKQGLATADNNRFLRLWYEVVPSKVDYSAHNVDEAIASGKKWFPYNKGGDFRKWYGNNEYLVNWEDDGYEIKHMFDEKGKLRSRPQNIQYFFRESVSWSLVSSSVAAFRYKPYGHIFDIAGMSLFSAEHLFYLLALCNSKYAMKALAVI